MNLQKPCYFFRYMYPLTDDMEYNLVVGLRLPFKYDSSLRYPFVYIWAVIAFMYCSHFIMITDLIMQAHLIHLICQFTVLSDCFENLLADCHVGFEGKNKVVTEHKTSLKLLWNISNHQKLFQEHNKII